MMQINSGTVPFTLALNSARVCDAYTLFCSPNFNYWLGCMTHMVLSDSCSLALDINTVTYLLILPST